MPVAFNSVALDEIRFTRVSYTVKTFFGKDRDVDHHFCIWQFITCLTMCTGRNHCVN